MSSEPERDSWAVTLEREIDTSDKNPLVALLLSVRLGWSGADRFYLGSFILGALKLCTVNPKAFRNFVRRPTLVLDAQTNFLPLQNTMSAEVGKLQSMMDGSPVDEAKVLDEVDRVLALERQIKREQLTLMITLKNLLTQQQQDFLAKLRQ